MKITIVGIDPALRNTGLAAGIYDLTTGQLDVQKVQLITTANGKGKQVRASSDDYRCASEMRAGILAFCATWKPLFTVAELPTGTQSARGSMSNGICMGVLAGPPAPLIEVTPSEVKVAACGYKLAQKEEIIEWAVAKWPDAGWLTKKVKGELSLTAANEHIADACAAIAAGILTPQFKNAVHMMSFAHAA